MCTGKLLDWAGRMGEAVALSGNFGRDRGVPLAGVVDCYACLSSSARREVLIGAARAMADLNPYNCDLMDRGLAVSFLAAYLVLDESGDAVDAVEASGVSLSAAFAGALCADPAGARGDLFPILAELLGEAAGPAGVRDFVRLVAEMGSSALWDRLPADLVVAAAVGA